MSLRTHFTELLTAVRDSPDQSFYRVISPSTSSSPCNSNSEWREITYLQFWDDIQHVARCWKSVLSNIGLRQGDVVTVWLVGMDYSDVVLAFGLSGAGYIPHFVSAGLTDPDLVGELVATAHSKALIFDRPGSIGMLSTVPSFPKTEIDGIPQSNEGIIIPKVENAADWAFIFQTSGSTSGSPKLVPNTFGWIDGLWQRMAAVWSQSKETTHESVTQMGSICHIGQWFTVLSAILHRACVVQPTSIAYSSEELMKLIKYHHLTRIFAFSPFLQVHLLAAQKDKSLLNGLRELHQVIHTGVPLRPDYSKWATSEGIHLTNMFGSTECGPMLVSVRYADGVAGLSPLPGTKYEFRQACNSTEERLLEMVVTPSSCNLPHESFLDPEGCFRTGDLFTLVSEGCYEPRGRSDDWIKSQNSLRCDAKSIEDHVRECCSDLVGDCVVLGQGRPSPTLLVEPLRNERDSSLPHEIIKRIAPFHARRYIHERITNPAFVIIVEPLSLPRTAAKRGIRRQVAEEQYSAVLDELYRIHLTS